MYTRLVLAVVDVHLAVITRVAFVTDARVVVRATYTGGVIVARIDVTDVGHAVLTPVSVETCDNKCCCRIKVASVVACLVIARNTLFIRLMNSRHSPLAQTNQ